jgi:hypothetical protein
LTEPYSLHAAVLNYVAGGFSKLKRDWQPGTAIEPIEIQHASKQ